jgi:hypothetical protein
MVSKKTIKDYGFQYLTDYYDYIIESEINGQRSQARELINSLSKPQLVYFTDFIKGNEELTALTLQALKR